MPKGIDWFHFLYVNLGYMALILAMYFFVAIDDIKKNWPKYRCNPMYMGLSDDIQKDMTFCVQNIQTGYMGHLMEPITYLLSNLSSMGSEFTGSLNFARNMIANIRGFISSITDSIFGVFVNFSRRV